MIDEYRYGCYREGMQKRLVGQERMVMDLRNDLHETHNSCLDSEIVGSTKIREISRIFIPG